MPVITTVPSAILLDHQNVTHPATIVGDFVAIDKAIEAVVHFYHAIREAAANTNSGEFWLQLSAAATAAAAVDDFDTVGPFTTSTTQPANEALNDAAGEPAGETQLAVTFVTGFAAKDKLYIEDLDAVGQSEWRYLQEVSTHLVIVDGLTYAKAQNDMIWNGAEWWSMLLMVAPYNWMRCVYCHEGSTGADTAIKVTYGLTMGVA